LPKGGDAHDEHRNDQALQVYLAFEKEGGYDVLGYVWDNQQAENDDSVIRHTYRTALYGRVDAATLVVRRGASEEWVRQTRNLAADYRKYFGGESPKLVAAGIWCDSDQTNSFAEGYMGPLRLGD